MSEELIKPYGDTIDDGKIQLAFTLPVENSARAKKAAEAYVAKLNCSDIQIVHSKKIADGFTYFVAFANANPKIDYSVIEASEVESTEMDFYQINSYIKENFSQPLTVVGATIGTDAHTVGIDAILNMKGFNANYGLERYEQFETYNMGAQVTAEELLEKAEAVGADALLISQTVTQKDSHLRNFTYLMELLEAEGLRDKYLILIGGPRISHEMAIELGYDAGFGPGTLPSHVGEYIATSMHKRAGN
ncbi:cobalamin-dependent protein [bacterium]|nr:cobalamin-dependent protein [bacterium]